MELAGMAEAAARAADLLAAARGRGLPCFHIQHLAVRPEATFFLPGTPGAEIHPCVQPLPGDPIITKNFPNGFRDTALRDSLQAAGIDALVIGGAMSHMCIDATARAAADYGYRGTVIHDACATRDLSFQGRVIPAAQVHGAFMAALAPFYARVSSLAEFLGSL